jgi:hypothetical protein
MSLKVMNRRLWLASCTMLVLVCITSGGSLALAQTDITNSSLPHTSDSVIFNWYNYYAPENVSNNQFGLYYGSWHSGDERTGEPLPHWVAIDFGSPRVVKQLRVLAFSENYNIDLRLKDFRFEGSNDGVTYIPLHNGLLQYENKHEWQTFCFNNDIGYRYYRLYGLSNWGCGPTNYCEQMIIEEWEMFEVGCPVPVQAHSWSQIKALYR